MGALGELPVCPAPPSAAGEGLPGSSRDKAGEVRLPSHHSEAEVGGVLALELLGGGEEVGGTEVEREGRRDGRLAEPHGSLEDDEPLRLRDGRLDLAEDLLLHRAHLREREAVEQGPPPWGISLRQGGAAARAGPLPGVSLTRVPHFGQKSIAQMGCRARSKTLHFYESRRSEGRAKVVRAFVSLNYP